MPTTVQLRDDFDAGALRRLAKTSRDNRQIRRLLALAAVHDGMSRAEAAQVGGMDRQTLRDWAHQFNAEGPEGQKDRARPGRERWLNDAQMAQLAEIVETGPDPAVDGVVRWRCIDLKHVIADRFGVVYSERSQPRIVAPAHLQLSRRMQCAPARLGVEDGVGILLAVWRFGPTKAANIRPNAAQERWGGAK